MQLTSCDLRSSQVAAFIGLLPGGQVIVAGGRRMLDEDNEEDDAWDDDHAPLKSAEYFSFDTMEWLPLPHLAVPRYGAAGAVLIAGGG